MGSQRFGTIGEIKVINNAAMECEIRKSDRKIGFHKQQRATERAASLTARRRGLERVEASCIGARRERGGEDGAYGG